MKDTATFRRTAAAVGLVATALLMIVSIVLAPEFPGDVEARLAAIDAAGTGGRISALAFGLAQLPLVAGLLGIGHLLRQRSPRLSNIGTTLGVVGAFGHSVFAGVTMVYLSMAGDSANRSVHADVLRAVESGPAVAFMVMGLLGTVLGLLVLSIGLWRARVAPRWAGPALWVFLAVEFAGQGLIDWASEVAVVIHTVAFTALAATIWRSPAALWRTGTDSAGDREPLASMR